MAVSGAESAIGTARDIAAGLQQKLGDRVRAVVVFGSAARGEYVDGVSDINMVAVLDRVDAGALQAASALAGLMHASRVRLLVIAQSDLDGVSDTFCMELLDMREGSLPLLGDDPFTGVPVDSRLLRRQAEREVRTRLLRLHAEMLHAFADRGSLGELLRDALPAFVTYLRASLRLAARPVPASMPDVIRAGCELVGADPGGLHAAFAARVIGGEWRIGPDDPIVETFRSSCERIVGFIDRFEGDDRQ